MTLDGVMKQWVTQVEPFIKPNLIKKHNSWYIILEEVWPEETEGSYSLGPGSVSLDDCVSWVEKEITRWPGVRRMAWDQWCFDDRRTAEKFLTLFYLIWER